MSVQRGKNALLFFFYTRECKYNVAPSGRSAGSTRRSGNARSLVHGADMAILANVAVPIDACNASKAAAHRSSTVAVDSNTSTVAVDAWRFVQALSRRLSIVCSMRTIRDSMALNINTKKREKETLFFPSASSSSWRPMRRAKELKKKTTPHQLPLSLGIHRCEGNGGKKEIAAHPRRPHPLGVQRRFGHSFTSP